MSNAEQHIAAPFENFEANITGGAANIKKALGDHGATSPRERLWMVPFAELVVVEGFNPREETETYLERIRKYAEDMAENGFNPAKPITVLVNDKDEIVITDGHTRYRAAKLAREELGATNLDMIPAIAKEKGTSEEDLTVSLVKDNDGERLSPLALSIVVKRMTTKFGNTPAEAAKKLSISPKWANQLLVLAGAPGRIRDLIAAGVVSATRAIELLEELGADGALELIEQGLTNAKEKGKSKSTKKHQKDATETAEDRQNKVRERVGKDVVQLVEILFQRIDDGEVDQNAIPKDLFERLEHFVSLVEAAAEE